MGTNVFILAYENGFSEIIMSPHQRGGGHIFFGADPVGVSTSVTVSCLHDIL